MKKDNESRTYLVDEVIVFQKNNDPFGELSNMASNFPLLINGVAIRTNEALYQACRYPDYPNFQQNVIEQKSPMAAKFVSRKYASYARSDWDNVKVGIMRWCLKVKLALHWTAFGEILLSTEDKPIVELSKTDVYWGAKLMGNGTLSGQNILGRLLMELRTYVKEGDQQGFQIIEPPAIKNFLLYGESIEIVNANINKKNPDIHTPSEPNKPNSTEEQLTLPF